MATLLRAGLRQAPRLVAFNAIQRAAPAIAPAIARLAPLQVRQFYCCL